MPTPAQTHSPVHTFRLRFPRPLLVALCTALLSQAAHALNYAPAATYATGSAPLFAASADFNGDGKPDLAVANGAADTVSVLLNNGNGTFAAAVNHVTGDLPAAIAIGDFDGDGHLDLAVANNLSGNVSILRGNGAGSFAAAVNYAAGTGPASVVAGDFDADGDLDLAVANANSGNVSILLNNGDGTFALKVDYPTGSSTVVASVATGDFDADGDLDLAVTGASTNTVSILLNNGNGTFAPKVDYTTGSFPQSVAVGDFDADGDLDLAVVNSDANTVSILLNNGGGTFASTSPPIAVGGRASHVVVANLDADGRLDLVVANFTGNSVSVVPGNGDGTFQAALNLDNGLGSIARAVGVSDVNGDGRPDLFVANQGTGDVSVYLAIPVPSAPAIGTATGGDSQISVTFAPPVFSGDGPVLDYTATCGTRSATGTASPIVVTGLTNGTTYDCRVVARNAVGMGPASAPSNSVTPATIPGAPTIGTAIAGNAQVSVAFTAPVSNGGSAILDYTATCGGQSATGGPSPITVSGLVNGTAYTCTVVARNAVGTGPASAASNSVTPVSVPFAPTGVVATAGSARITVAFTPGGSGGSPIVDFTATCGTQSMTGAAPPLVVTGLANGTTYTCTVVARNAVGTSAPSTASNSATPTTNSFSGPSATGTGTITAIFSGGGPTCTYTVSRFISLTGDPASPPAGTAPAGTTFPHGLFDFTTSGCTPASTITMTITYPAPLLAGTQYWKYGPTPSSPAPHWYVLPATITGNTVTFTITDGALGDDDLTANGTIVDQGGPGVPIAAAAIPTLSEWAMLLLASLVMLAGMGTLRRRA